VDHREALRLELIGLKSGEGLSVGRVADSPVLLTAFGGTNPPGGYYQLVSLLYALGDGSKARALRAAFGVGFRDPMNLTKRREYIAAELDRSIDSIKDYEDEALKDLITHIEHNPGDLMPGYPATRADIQWVVTDKVLVVSKYTFYDPVDHKAKDAVRTHENQQPGPPIAMWQVPWFWELEHLKLRVVFNGEAKAGKVYLAVSPSVTGLAQPTEQQLIAAKEPDTDAWTFAPQPIHRGWWYALWWEWDTGQTALF
jgi:hypothetical protein